MVLYVIPGYGPKRPGDSQTAQNKSQAPLP
jgi:hypothetical protein